MFQGTGGIALVSRVCRAGIPNQPTRHAAGWAAQRRKRASATDSIKIPTILSHGETRRASPKWTLAAAQTRYSPSMAAQTRQQSRHQPTLTMIPSL